MVFLSACDNDKYQNTAINLTDYFTVHQSGLIDLREFNEELDMRYIDARLRQIPSYANTIDYLDFLLSGRFDIGQKFAGFTVVNIDVWDDVSPVEIRIDMQFANAEGAEQTERVEFTFFYTQSENIDAMGLALMGFARPGPIFESGLDIGDFTYGGSHSIDFIRGNVHVWINRGISGSTDVTDLAKAIDQTILSMLRL